MGVVGHVQRPPIGLHRTEPTLHHSEIDHPPPAPSSRDAPFSSRPTGIHGPLPPPHIGAGVQVDRLARLDCRPHHFRRALAKFRRSSREEPLPARRRSPAAFPLASRRPQGLDVLLACSKQPHRGVGWLPAVLAVRQQRFAPAFAAQSTAHTHISTTPNHIHPV